jgi:hypothetical protein
MNEDDVIKYYDIAFRQTKENRKAALSRMTTEELTEIDVELEEMQFNLKNLMQLVNKEWKVRDREAIRRGEEKVVHDHKTGISTKKGRAERERGGMDN